VLNNLETLGLISTQEVTVA